MSSTPEQVSPQAESAYQSLLGFLRAGEFGTLAEAAAVFLQQYPDHGGATHLLGFSRLALGDAAASRGPLEAAAVLSPDNSQIWDHLGAACNLLGDHAAAAAAFSRSLEGEPDRAETWVNHGKNLRDMGQIEAARDAYLRALSLREDLFDAHNNLSVVLDTLGQPDQALAAADRALALAPEKAWAHLHRGNALKNLGRISEALQAYDRALTLAPTLSQGWNNLADALFKAGDTGNALVAAERAKSYAPQDPEVLNTLATIYAISGRRADAEAALKQAIELDVNNHAAWLNLGFVLEDLPQRIASLERALAIDPQCDRALSALLFVENYRAERTSGELLTLARRYGEILSARISPYTLWSNKPLPDRLLRVGIVSPDLCEHPVSYFMEGFLLAAQGMGIEWHAYSCVERPDSTTARLKASFTGWRNILHLPDQKVAEQIRADGIDILVDLAGHTAGNRLPVFAYRPSPVQMTWLGYSGTTGVPAIDYLLADRYIFPDGEPPTITEQPWRLPEVFMSFTAPPFDIPCNELPLATRAYPTFGCFNNLFKINDRVLNLWAQVMAAVPDARLLIRAKQLGFDTGRDAFVARLVRAGIDSSRVELSGSLPTREDALREYQRVDIALDPFPYNGTTTSCEALWMGVPVLTMKGDRMIARVGHSINANLGLAEWVANDEADFVERAVRLSCDVELLTRLRKTLRTRGAASPLGNPTWFANQMTTALRAMWRQWCAAQ